MEGYNGLFRDLPIILELVWIPAPFLKSSTINNSDAFVHTSYTDFIGTKSDNVSILDMCSMNGLILFISVSPPQDPKRRERRREMGIGNLGKRGKKDRKDETLVDKVDTEQSHDER